MAKNFNKIGAKVALKDLGLVENEKCSKCGEPLRLGENRQKNQWTYCPHCKERRDIIFISRFHPVIKLESHKD